MESLPEGLSYQSSSSTQQSIADHWLQLLDEAERSVDIAAFYFTLRSSDLDAEESSDQQVSSSLLFLQAIQNPSIYLTPPPLTLGSVFPLFSREERSLRN